MNHFGNFSSAKQHFIQLFKKYSFVLLFGLFFGMVLYSLMMSHQLTNTFDGLWQQNYHQSGTVELTSGRWMLYFIDRCTMGLHADPITSIAALILFITGFLLVLDLFGIGNKAHGCLTMMLFLASTAICNTLSYRFTSLGYGLAYLLAVSGIYAAVKIRSDILATGLSGILLGLSMSCYQAYLAVFGVIALFYIIFFLGTSERSTSDAVSGELSIYRILLRIVSALLIGAVTYVVSLSLILRFTQASLSEYNGIGDLSAGSIILGLPRNILRTYRYFGAYFFRDTLKINCLQPYGMIHLLFVLFFVLTLRIAGKAWRTGKMRALILLSAVIAMPVASNAYMLIAGNKLELQMTAGLAMFMPLTFLLGFSCDREKGWLKQICAILCTVLVYGSAMQVWYDQEAMYEGQEACETMMTQVISDLQEENLLSKDYDYRFVGVPADNPFFSVSSIYHRANAYAQMGNFWTSGSCSQMSYNGLVNKRMGFSLRIPNLNYDTIPELIPVSEMPSFPQDGYISLLDDHTVVVKISEYGPYEGHSKYVFD